MAQCAKSTHSLKITYYFHCHYFYYHHYLKAQYLVHGRYSKNIITLIHSSCVLVLYNTQILYLVYRYISNVFFYTSSLLTQANYTHSTTQTLTLDWNDTSPQNPMGKRTLHSARHLTKTHRLTVCHGLDFAPLIFFSP